jgi:hypothetical protein
MTESGVANLIKTLRRSDTGLHWPDLDEDLSVIGIIEGKFGS